MSTEEDEWDCFGSSDDEEEEEVAARPDTSCIASSISSREQADSIATFIAKTFLISNKMVSLSVRRVLVFIEDNNNNNNNDEEQHLLEVANRIQLRDIHVVIVRADATSFSSSTNTGNGTENEVDCAILSNQIYNTQKSRVVNQLLVPGGFVLILNGGISGPTNKAKKNETEMSISSSQQQQQQQQQLDLFPKSIWKIESQQTIESRTKHDDATAAVVCLHKRCGLVNSIGCLWKSNRASHLDYERSMVEAASIQRSAYERAQPHYSIHAMNEHSRMQASASLLEHGFVVIRDLFPRADVEKWGDAALRDFESALSVLKTRDGIDLLSPGGDRHRPAGSNKEPLSYHELAMREDLRCDLRNGAAFKQMRHDDVDAQRLRAHPCIVQIVQQAFNPRGRHYRGNFGRYNFDGTGPDGSHMPLKIGEVGAVITVPGAADQAIHADTPHLFEHCDLPPHYANLFIPAAEDTSFNNTNTNDKEQCIVTGDTLLGGTAFVVGSHSLSVCEELMANDEDGDDTGDARARLERERRTVRPSIRIGDALIFDCRLLHFGLGNRSKRNQRRPLLYINLTHEWFVDPKNWDDREKLFPDVEAIATGGGMVHA